MVRPLRRAVSVAHHVAAAGVAENVVDLAAGELLALALEETSLGNLEKQNKGVRERVFLCILSVFTWRQRWARLAACLRLPHWSTKMSPLGV